MEVSITSREMVKPSSPELVLQHKPFRLSFIDQLVTNVYFPVIFFYYTHPKNISHVVNQLKQSLSKALNRLYPLSGRVINNLYVSSYEEGVAYMEARVNRRLSDYLGQQVTLMMNELLPCQPFRNLPNTTVPLLAIQVNIFECGGIALAVCYCHKIIDATTLSSFLKTWAAFNRGGCEGEIPNPDFDSLNASSRLLSSALESIPPKYESLFETLWFPTWRCKSRSFVFDADAIATLKLKAASKGLEHPTRVTALIAFVWKHAMLASRSTSGISKLSLLSLTVNLRPRMKPQLPDYSIGNLFWNSNTSYNSNEKDIKLHDLAYLAREGVKSFERDYVDLLQADASQYLAMTEPMIAQTLELAAKGNVESYGFSSWLNTMDGKGVDFGWGDPSLFTIPKVDAHDCKFGNIIILKEVVGQQGAIEAWINLEEKAMAVLEHDCEFLQFASPTNY